MKKFVFIGDGAGVPGLPREISQAEIDFLKPEQIAVLQEAVENGLYIEMGADPKPVPSHKKSKVVVADTSHAEGDQS